MSFSPPPGRRIALNENGARYPRNGIVSRRDFSPPPSYNNHNNINGNGNSRPRRQINNGSTQDASKPLLEPDAPRPVPPLAGPEIDDLDDRETISSSQPGVDDGFFSNGNKPRPDNPDAEDIPKQPKIPEPTYPNEEPEFTGTDETDLGRYPANHPRFPDFPYAPGFGPEVYNVNFPDYPPTEFGVSESIPDVNVYQHKKTLAQGMMDLALFSANANQLRYVLESYDRHPYYYPSIILISISLIFQIAVGVGLIWNSRYNVKDKKEICIANKINNFTIIGIFLVTVVNVFISAFGVANAPSSQT